MRVLFLENHPMWIHGLPNGFRDLGHNVKISGVLTKNKIPYLLRTFRPDLIVSLGWTAEHSVTKRKWVHQYVKKSGIPHVFWATEDPTHHQTFSAPYVSNVQPDFVFTISAEKVRDYIRMGIPAAHMDFGYHHSVHQRGKIEAKYKSSLAVVANGYSKILKQYPDHYRIHSLQQLIVPLLQDGTKIDFWGRHWSQMKPILGIQVPTAWIHGYLHYTEACKVYSSADMIIGPQNHLSQVTQRTYEILGSGGFLLTSDTPEVRRLFIPGRDLVVSSSPFETRQLIHYYSNRPNEREQIRQQGMHAVQRHSYKERASYMIHQLKMHHII
ncbi:CgeB family protein [Paenibacillus arenosi]|uniref:Glycosyltransferase n=1 Tax=Paenibacillus arenosi TaxID=2774142 RepID=A0ABR9B0Y0_9BACL|nr:glycosyltransferase [Paenibacillus arenosi]MBD8499613.1 glycosyltransferase [Paenibacillus arenosi]